MWIKAFVLSTVMAAAVCPLARAAEHVTLKNGFELDCVRREAVGQVVDAELAKLLERLRGYPGIAGLKPPLAPQSPVLPITFRRGDERVSYFSLITTVGTHSA